MGLFIKGIIAGFIIVLPGMSGGTIFVVFGLYEKMVKDFTKLNFKPYYPLLLGIVIGIFTGGRLFIEFFEAYRDITTAFLLGCLLASIRSVLRDTGHVSLKKGIFLGLGLFTGLFVVSEPVNLMSATTDVNFLLLLTGGALASTTMILPGVPGSSILIVLGIYDNMLFYIRSLNLLKLIYFCLGSIIGVVFLLKILDRIYSSYRNLISYYFAGLILGASRVLIPYKFTFIPLIMLGCGFLLVWKLGEK